MNQVLDFIAPAARNITRLSDLTPSQQQAIRKIPAEKHAANVPLAAARPNAIFTGRDRFDQEQANIRQVSGRIGYEPAMLDEDAEANVHKLATHAHTAFPNVVIVTSQYHPNVMILMPGDVDHTTVHYFMLTPGPTTTPKAEEVFKRSYELIISVFGGKDFRAAEISQAGLSTSVSSEVVYCGLEANIVHYYEALEALVERK